MSFWLVPLASSWTREWAESVWARAMNTTARESVQATQAALARKAETLSAYTGTSVSALDTWWAIAASVATVRFVFGPVLERYLFPLERVVCVFLYVMLVVHA